MENSFKKREAQRWLERNFERLHMKEKQRRNGIKIAAVSQKNKRWMSFKVNDPAVRGGGKKN